ncbi:MAG TPA: hypothetical protein VHK06_05955, partial [Candidatus Limnocylindria bacterium]|nr:hypothetical protein [Candidatus Limnocylindria bacterium]
MSAVRAARLALPLVLVLWSIGADPGAVRAADPLAVVTSARYEVAPDSGRVRVTVDATATSNMPDSATERFYFSGVTLAVQPGATGFAASGEGQPLTVEVAEETDDYIALDVVFSRSVFYQQSYAFTLTFDLVDPGGDPYRPLVITRNFLSVPVWAYGTPETPGSSVTLVVPGDYRASVEIGEMRMTPGEGRALVLSSTDIPRPLEYFSHVVIERRAPLTLERDFTVTLGDRPAEIRLRAWEDDAAWADAVQETLTDGLPALVDAIGLDYPIAGALTVREAAYSRLGDYAGIYEPLSRTIEMHFDPDPFVTLHEAAHIWF